MDARERRRLELDRQIGARRKAITDAAIAEFIEKGIDNSRISDIALRAGVGPVTIYRYYSNKPGLVIDCATKLWNDETERFRQSFALADIKKVSGFEQACLILASIASMYEECPVLLKLMEQFDNYIVREHIPKASLRQYEESIMDIREMMLEAVRKGQKDGTVRRDIDGPGFYLTSTHALVALSQKLLLRGDVIESDAEMGAKNQITLLMKMELEYIKGTEGAR